VPDHGDGGRAGALVGVGERAAEERARGRDAERRGADLRHVRRQRLAVARDEVALRQPVRPELRDRLQLGAPGGEVVQHARLRAPRGRVPALERHHAVGVGEGEPRGEHLAGELERARGHPDGEREGEPADEREPRVLHEHADAELEVEPRDAQPVERAQPPRLAGGVLVQLGAPEVEPRLAPRLRRGEAGAHEVRGAQLQVEAELFRHLRLDVRPPAHPPPQRAAARDQPRDHRPLS
jgi:hypothetical protein